MTTNKTRDLVAQARNRLKERNNSGNVEIKNREEDRFPATEIHTASGAGKETLKRIAAKEVDPKRCRPWNFHNRDLAWLNADKSSDLIDSITKNGQLEPGLVRAIEGDKDFDYEIIYGVRRWFACSQIPGQKYLVKITTADDKQCSILMHIENADSKDITEFERAHSFLQQFRAKIFKNQSEMAKCFGITQGLVSRSIKAAEIYEISWIRELLPDMLGVNIKAAYKISQLLSSADGEKSVRVEAAKIKIDLDSGKKFPSSIILKRLASGAASSSAMASDTVLLSSNGLSLVEYKKSNKALYFLITLPLDSMNKEEAFRVIKSKIEEEVQS